MSGSSLWMKLNKDFTSTHAPYKLMDTHTQTLYKLSRAALTSRLCENLGVWFRLGQWLQSSVCMLQRSKFKVSLIRVSGKKIYVIFILFLKECSICTYVTST